MSFSYPLVLPVMFAFTLVGGFAAALPLKNTKELGESRATVEYLEAELKDKDEKLAEIRLKVTELLALIDFTYDDMPKLVTHED